MKTKIQFPFLILLGFIFTSCAIQPLGYFEVDPYAKPFPEEKQKSLNIYLHDDIPNALIVEGVGLKSMAVSRFRESVRESLANTFDKNFNEINFVDTKDEGLTLVVYRVKPFWKLSNVSSTATGTGGETYSTNTEFVSAAFEFESSLFYDGKLINESDSLVYSDHQWSKIKNAHEVFQNGLLKTCEAINDKLFSKEFQEANLSSLFDKD